MENTLGMSLGLSSQTAVLATMHQKERAIAPVFSQHLGMTVTVLPNFNSDRFGTFTRDVARQGTQIEAARFKAQVVFEQTDATVAIASEGAFFPHPALPFAACDREIVLLTDRELGIEITGHVLSTETNYRHRTVRSVDEALEFAESVGFPSHGLVVMPAADGCEVDTIYKGICTQSVLIDAVESTLRTSPHQTAHLETDMRAMHNPTRMGVIAEAARDLVAKIRQRCPSCGCPGFDVVERRPGLPCALCGLPTELIRAAIYRCQTCSHTQEDLFPDGEKNADPGRCWNCNP
jgi:hypothetical protein